MNISREANIRTYSEKTAANIWKKVIFSSLLLRHFSVQIFYLAVLQLLMCETTRRIHELTDKFI
jgi:hypothetical protein